MLDSASADFYREIRKRSRGLLFRLANCCIFGPNDLWSMSDIRFSCSACGQHFAGEARYAGTQIKCPSCGQMFTVPAPQTPAPVVGAASSTGTSPRAAVAGRAAPAAPLAAAKQPVSSSARTSRLAVASLVCSVGSFLIIPFGFIPGIICGHMARKRIALDPTLAGRGLAKAGLMVGYVALGIQGLALLVMLAFVLFFGARIAREVSVPPGQTPPMARAQRPHTVNAPGGRTGPADTTPDAAGWTLQLKGASIPIGPVGGRIKGSDFVSEKPSLQGGLLKFAQGADSFPDLEMSVVLPVILSGQLSGKTFTVPSKEPGGNPQISMRWKQAGKNTPEERSWTEGYAMRLEFDKMLNGKLPGRIYLCVPDEEKSFIRGTFEVPLRRERGGAGFTPTGPAPTRP